VLLIGYAPSFVGYGTDATPPIDSRALLLFLLDIHALSKTYAISAGPLPLEEGPCEKGDFVEAQVDAFRQLWLASRLNASRDSEPLIP